MSYTDNYGIPEMPSGAVEWVAIFNDLITKVEAGRTIKITGGETLATGDAVGLPSAAGKVSKVDNTGDFLGIVKSTSIILDAEGYVYVGIGNEITVGTGWTIGGLIYVHTVAGSITQVKPTPQAVAIGYAESATSIVLLRSEVDLKGQLINNNFMQSDVAASQTAVALNVLGLAGNTEVTMAKPGSVVGISIASNDARTAGTLTVDVTIDGTATGLQAILNGDNAQYHYATQVLRTDTFTAGQRIGVKITTGGDWTPDGTPDIVVSVLVEV